MFMHVSSVLVISYFMFKILSFLKKFYIFIIHINKAGVDSMKIRESRLRRVIRKVIIENENNGDNGDNDDDDFDIYRSFDEEADDTASDDFDFSDEDSRKHFDSGSAVREKTILQKFCDQFGIPEEYIAEFYRAQAFHGGLDYVPVSDQGEDLDDSVKN